MIKPSQIQLLNRYGQMDSKTMEAAITAALALTPYVRFIEPHVGTRRYFVDIIRSCNGLLEAINEICPINIDLITSRAFNVFEVRYNEAVYAKSTTLLLANSRQHEAFLENSTCIPPQELVDKLLVDFQKAASGEEK